MELSLEQSFEDSRKATEDYMTYIARKGEEQQEDINGITYSLYTVTDEVRQSGIVSVMAAKESMQSHNSTFKILTAMTKAQSALTQLVTDLRLNGNVGGGGGTGSILGSMVEGAITAATTAIAVTNGGALPFTVPIAAAGAAIGGIVEVFDGANQKYAEEREQASPNSLTNKALEASAEAERFTNLAYYSLNPAPNPLMNGPGMVQDGVDFKDIPFVHTAKEAYAIVMAINEADRYLEATGQRTPLYAGLDMENYDTPDSSNFFVNGIIEQQPQSVQVVTQPASTSVAPEQTINFNIQNDFNGNWQDRRGLEDIGEYLARQVKDRLNSGAPLFSGN
ncbi:MAG: hypothetical protein VB035_04045 [Candidatus Fimivivens sp.]|nr:hypothetical protein [Candidatus Fimivivens sp.]